MRCRGDFWGKISKIGKVQLFCIVLGLVLTGCGSGGSGGKNPSEAASLPVTEAAAESKALPQAEAPAESDPKEEPGTATGSLALPGSPKAPGSANDPANDDSSGDNTGDSQDTGNTFAKRLCGTYSRKNSEGGYSTLEIFEFGGNVYAHGGEAMESDESLEPYSFWAMELIPEKKESFTKTDTDEAGFGILTFSVMSNLSRYWGAPELRSFTLKGDELYFDNETDPYKRNNNVETAFSSVPIDAADSSTKDLKGMWREKTEEQPLYLDFSGDGKIRLYKKYPDKEVFFACGGCNLKEDGTLSARYNPIHNLAPEELEASYIKIDENSFSLESNDDLQVVDGLYALKAGQKTVFERISPSEVPIITLDDIKDLDYINIYEEPSEMPEGSEGFYGVWILSSKDPDKAGDAYLKLEDKNYYDSAIIFSPDYANLSTEPYYCVTSGKFGSKENAEKRLSELQAAGFKDAYIKFTGPYLRDKLDYTVYSLDHVEIKSDKVVLRDVPISYPFTTTDGDNNKEITMTLIVDKDTVFDETCEMQFFNNYEKGDTVLEWFQKNKRLSEEDPDLYSASLMGIFEVALSGNHVDRYYGCYWWD